MNRLLSVSLIALLAACSSVAPMGQAQTPVDAATSETELAELGACLRTIQAAPADSSSESSRKMLVQLASCGSGKRLFTPLPATLGLPQLTALVTVAEATVERCDQSQCLLREHASACRMAARVTGDWSLSFVDFPSPAAEFTVPCTNEPLTVVSVLVGLADLKARIGISQLSLEP